MQVSQCKAWKELSEASQQLVAERLASLATTFGQWQSAAADEMLEAYVRHLRQGSEATPRAQRAVLRCLRLAERCQVQSKALEQLEMLGSRAFFILFRMWPKDKAFGAVAATDLGLHEQMLGSDSSTRAFRVSKWSLLRS